MRIELIEDPRTIAELFTHPDIIGDIINDECSDITTDSMEQGITEILPESLYFKVLNNSNSIVGIMSFHDQPDEFALDMHGAFLKGFRGRFAVKAIKESIKIVFQHTQYEKIWVRFSSKRLVLLKIASYLGFKLEHIIEESYPYGGVLYDTICMTLTKKDFNNA